MRISATVGETLAANTCVLVIEAMKMECEIRSDRAGVLESLHVETGMQVSSRQMLAVVRPPEETVS